MSLPETGLAQTAARIRFELTDLDEPTERSKLEHPSDEHWTIFSVSNDGHSLTWSLLPDCETGPSKSTSEGATKAALMEEKIRKFNVSHISQNHGAILIACAQDRTKKNTRLESQNHTRKDEDDDPSSRAFDREKDMAISSKISNAQRREMVDKAGGYSSRFKKGNFL